MSTINGLPAITSPQLSERPDNGPLMEAARALEASFLAEMLKSAGFGEGRGAFGGGSGEDQFTSFLVRAHAEEMVRVGGIGLAEALFESLKERTDGAV